MIRLLAAVLVFSAMIGADGDLRLRLWRRFPSCRGTLEQEYTGDEWSFLERLRFGAGPIRGVFMMEKDRGEDWVDLVTGGMSFSSGSTVLYAGWLKAQLGSGIVLSHPGGWSAADPVSFNKPPAIRNRIDLAGSSWDSDGSGLTGVAALFGADCFEISLLQCISRTDPSEGGLHRTLAETDSKGSVREILSAARIATGIIGITASAGWERDDVQTEWQRAGVDWQLTRGTFLVSGEAAAGHDSGGTSAAYWASVAQSTEGFRQSFSVSGYPESFPDTRSFSPEGSHADLGLRYGIRWKIFPVATLSAGTRMLLRQTEDSFKASAEILYRFSPDIESKIRFRTGTTGDENSWRLLAQIMWEAADRVLLTGKLQSTGWSEQDSTENGVSAGIRLKYGLSSCIEIRGGATAFDTDGYNSRVYAAELAFPGEFGSGSLYDRGFLLQSSVVAKLRENVAIRAKLAWQQREGADFFGSGPEQTEGPNRVETGIQIDFAF